MPAAIPLRITVVNQAKLFKDCHKFSLCFALYVGWEVQDKSGKESSILNSLVIWWNSLVDRILAAQGSAGCGCPPVVPWKIEESPEQDGSPDSSCQPTLASIDSLSLQIRWRVMEEASHMPPHTCICTTRSPPHTWTCMHTHRHAQKEKDFVDTFVVIGS